MNPSSAAALLRNARLGKWARILVRAAVLLCLSVGAAWADSRLIVGKDFPDLKAALAAALQLSDGSVTIAVPPGTYRGQRVRIEWPNRSPAITVQAANDIRPVFDGEGNGAWLTVVASGRKINLTINGLEVRRYQTAISLNGSETSEGWNGGVRVTNNVFADIGSQFKGQNRSTAAIRLVNSQQNAIERNVFLNITSIESCGALHAIYMAHGSSRNTIKHNLFDGGCGATIKVRNASNENIVTDNIFRNQAGKALFLDAPCGGPKCTRNECPSWGNVFADNSDESRSTEAVKIMQARNETDCLPSSRARVLLSPR